MKQDPNPIDPRNTGEIVLILDGKPLPFSASKIPALFVAYIAAQRAEYYAGVDAAKGADFTKVFPEEVSYALRHREELDDWLGNNTNWSSEKTDGVTVEYHPTRQA